jgi:hypothetical protein
MRITLVALLLMTSCSGAKVTQRGDGTYAVDCGERKACFDRADRLCERSGYVVVGGKSNKKRYGVPGNEKYIGKDEIYIRCNKDRPLDTPDAEAGSWKLKHAEAGAPNTPSAVATASAPKAVCRPGETQRCVGPGACEGGQACNADGSGYGACDCGSAPQEPKH